MRAIQRTKFFRLGLLYTVAGALSGVAACADSLHLDPPGVLPLADGGVEGGVACTSNLQCAYPYALCDMVAQTCVQCIVTADCSNPGNVCSREICICKPPTVPGPDGGTLDCVEPSGTGGGGTGGAGADDGGTDGGPPPPSDGGLEAG
jgi:hypothetical protein